MWRFDWNFNKRRFAIDSGRKDGEWKIAQVRLPRKIPPRTLDLRFYIFFEILICYFYSTLVSTRSDFQFFIPAPLCSALPGPSKHRKLVHFGDIFSSDAFTSNQRNITESYSQSYIYLSLVCFLFFHGFLFHSLRDENSANVADRTLTRSRHIRTTTEPNAIVPFSFIPLFIYPHDYSISISILVYSFASHLHPLAPCVCCYCFPRARDTRRPRIFSRRLQRLWASKIPTFLHTIMSRFISFFQKFHNYAIAYCSLPKLFTTAARLERWREISLYLDTVIFPLQHIK